MIYKEEQTATDEAKEVWIVCWREIWRTQRQQESTLAGHMQECEGRDRPREETRDRLSRTNST